MSFGIIYKVTNKINNKVYIGQTIQGINKRKQDHLSDNKNLDFSAFHRSLIKYKKYNFNWEVIKHCDDINDLNNSEIYYIEKFKSHVSFGKGYNISLGGGSSSGIKRSQETRDKLSASKKGKKLNLSSSERLRRSLSMSGKNNSCFKVYGKIHNSTKKFVIVKPNGISFVVEGLRNFCRSYKEEKLYHSGFVNCAKGKQSSHKGYKCRYYNEVLDSYIKSWEAE